MEQSLISLIPLAFVAGIFTFLAPCTLPLVPGYLVFIGGSSYEDLKNATKVKSAKGKIILNGLFFVLGFSAIFILFGLLAGSVGSVLAQYRIWLMRIGGIFVVLFGLFMLDLLRLPIFKTGLNVKTPKFLKSGTPINSFILGSSFGFGWTPCVGPILGSILLVASTSSTALQGALLLAIYSLGLGIPFILVAVGIGSSATIIAKNAKYLGIASKVGGLLLIGLGFLLFTNNMSLLITYGFELLQFINYEEALYIFL